MSEFQDWNPVVFKKKKPAQMAKGQPGSVSARVNKRNGNGGMSKNQRKADEADSADKIQRVSLSLSKHIQQARVAKGMDQKTLAQRINEKPQVIKDYECGKAIPSQQVLSKLRRVLGDRTIGAKTKKK